MDKNKIIMLAGNPNVGKSTVFNALTGLSQHTGNWTGKTVDYFCGEFSCGSYTYTLCDLPGMYSLFADGEEQLAGEYVACGESDAVIIVCDSTTLERNLILVLQVLSLNPHAVLCLNLADEAERKGISVNAARLEELLHIPVVPCVAQKKCGLDVLISRIPEAIANSDAFCPTLPQHVIECISDIADTLSTLGEENSRYEAQKLILCGKSCRDDYAEVAAKSGYDIEAVASELTMAWAHIAKELSDECVTVQSTTHSDFDRRIDRILTGKYTAVPIMLLLLALVLFITIYGANVPSEMLFSFFAWLGDKFGALLVALNASETLISLLKDGIYQTLTWVVSVMLPPMAIFFPMFTFLEDIGYLPRIAFNLDKHFMRSRACGKQALTMCMGFGCNAVGICGCRIISSERERKIAILTNNFVPCNGRFPTLISLVSMFFVTSAAIAYTTALSAVFLTLIIVIGIAMTFLVSKLLSKTLLAGAQSSFMLELPPYRRPQLLKILVNSLVTRTLLVLGRAVLVAAPAGLIIWLLANIGSDSGSLLSVISNALDPVGRFFGLDGVILLAFILGFPANEIVIPIVLMAYTASGSLAAVANLEGTYELLIQNGWTVVTAICTIIFMLFHFPCSTTCITIYKETRSKRLTALAFVLPTVIGLLLCAIVANVARIIL